MQHGNTFSAPSTPARAFTLIELLIVVAIIAILAAIAIPNFLEAQVRSKVARVESDLRVIATACESYYVDHNCYPNREDDWGNLYPDYPMLSTPIAYITTANLRDIFDLNEDKWNWANGEPVRFPSYKYMNYKDVSEERNPGRYSYMRMLGYLDRQVWMAMSVGPDQLITWSEWTVPNILGNGPWASKVLGYSALYDPTNGTVSRGDIIRVGGEDDLPGSLK